jgi:hypothetical protein
MKYIVKWTILSKCGIFANSDISGSSSPGIKQATAITIIHKIALQ